MIIQNVVGNVQLMQKINRLKVLNCIRLQGNGISRPKIAKITGLSLSSITNIVSHLLEKQLVKEIGTVEAKEVGRKAALLMFNPEAFYLLCINIETTNSIIALTDLDGNIIKHKVIEIDLVKRDYEILNSIKKEALSIIRKDQEKTITALGVAVSGLVEENRELVISSSLRWKGVSIKDFFEESFNMPVFLQNNSKTKAMVELRKYKNNQNKNIVFMDITKGIGIINFFEGKINEAVIGELGHTTVDKNGPVCFCGNRGCLEIMCCVETIIQQCSELLKHEKCGILNKHLKDSNNALNYLSVLEAFSMGDTDVEKVLKECAEYLGIGLTNIINIFNPDRIIINGDELLISDFIYEIAVKEANMRAYELFTKNLVYEKVNINAEMAVGGIALYVADKLFDIAGPDC